jgi:hypothetical protein
MAHLEEASACLAVAHSRGGLLSAEHLDRLCRGRLKEEDKQKSVRKTGRIASRVA